MLSLFHFRHCCHHDRRIILLCEKNGMKNKTFYYKRNIITTQTDRCSCSADVVTCVFIWQKKKILHCFHDKNRIFKMPCTYFSWHCGAESSFLIKNEMCMFSLEDHSNFKVSFMFILNCRISTLLNHVIYLLRNQCFHVVQ
jgi:hypothetical protein